MQDIRAKVREALDNAFENEYTFEGWTLDQICTDMLDYSSELEGLEIKDIKAHVGEFMREREPCEFCQKPDADCRCFHCQKCGHPDGAITPAEQTECKCHRDLPEDKGQVIPELKAMDDKYGKREIGC